LKVSKKKEVLDWRRMSSADGSEVAERSIRSHKRGRAVRAAPPRLNRISVETLNERAYVELRNAIMAARLLPGEAISLRGLARALGTSAQPIRDAVKRLMSEKALEAMPNRTVRVPPLTDERFRDLCRIRVLLEGEAAALAIKHITPEEIRRLEQLTSSMQTALTRQDFPTVFRCNQEFHFIVYRAAQSNILLSMIENLWLLAGPYLTVPLLRDRRNETLYEQITVTHHGSLIDAIRGRKPEAARKAVAADITTTAALLLRMNVLPHADAEPATTDR
jgi:DNA-binding GntR family transcriptional regulator